MDKNVLVETVKRYIKKSKEKNEHYNLAMLLNNDPNSVDTDYTLVLSAKWLDKKNPRQAINKVFTDFIKEIGKNKEEQKKLSRISIINSNDPFVVNITSTMSACRSTISISNCNFNGVIIDKGLLFESHKNIAISAKKKRATKQKKQPAA